MKEVKMWQCDCCGEKFYIQSLCEQHEKRHELHQEANRRWQEGYTIGEIQEQTKFFVLDVSDISGLTKDNCFVIEYWQCCEKPAYRIEKLDYDGHRVWMAGCGSWSGFYFNAVNLSYYALRHPYPKEALYVAERR